MSDRSRWLPDDLLARLVRLREALEDDEVALAQHIAVDLERELLEGTGR